LGQSLRTMTCRSTMNCVSWLEGLLRFRNMRVRYLPENQKWKAIVRGRNNSGMLYEERWVPSWQPPEA
jgi:hypothetical protein